MTTRWTCERCESAGAVPHTAHADVWTVAQMVRADHQRANGACSGYPDRVRVTVDAEPAK